VTWNNIRAHDTEGGMRLSPTTCDFWDVQMRATVDVAGPIEDRGFHVIFEGKHLFGPHFDDAIPNPFSVQMSVSNPHLRPPAGPHAQWVLLTLEEGTNFKSTPHPTTFGGGDHIDTFGLWGFQVREGLGLSHFWFSGVHCGTTFPGAVAPSQTCAELPQPPSIPEPHTIALVASGLVGLMVKRRRQRAP
jgi:hypothetical protein